MPKQPRIIGLDDFGLTPTSLSRLGSRPARLSLQLKGRSASQLRHLRPAQRDIVLRQTLAKQLDHLRRDFPHIAFVSRGKDKPSWTIDAVVATNEVVALASNRHVTTVTLTTIEGRRQRSPRPKLHWFCVWAVVAIQIELRARGSVDVEDRL